jgi:hypothetical protein
LSSSWLAQNGLRLDSPDILPAEVTSQLTILEDAVMNLLDRALRCGPVVIITNAETGWVELSCKKFIPRVQPYLGRVKILSARSTFEALYPDSPSDWKVRGGWGGGWVARAGSAGACATSFVAAACRVPPLQVQAFYQEICAAFEGVGSEARKNVLSFGDSVHERAAIIRVTSTMGAATRTKSIKFVERPTVEQLKRQIDLVASCFDEICRHTGNLDLMLTIQLLMG